MPRVTVTRTTARLGWTEGEPWDKWNPWSRMDYGTYDSPREAVEYIATLCPCLPGFHVLARDRYIEHLSQPFGSVTVSPVSDELWTFLTVDDDA